MSRRGVVSFGSVIRARLHVIIYSQPHISWYDAKLGIVPDAVRAYLAAPRFFLHPTA